MLRIVDMRQAASMEQGFAVWDTVVSRFVTLHGDQAFDGEDDFRACAKAHTAATWYDVDRIVSLLPEWAKSK